MATGFKGHWPSARVGPAREPSRQPPSALSGAHGPGSSEWLASLLAFHTDHLLPTLCMKRATYRRNRGPGNSAGRGAP